jgi:hypothetical protein
LEGFGMKIREFVRLIEEAIKADENSRSEETLINTLEN